MASHLAKPQRLDNLHSRLRTIYQTFHKQVIEMRKFYRKDFKGVVTRLPEGIKIHESSTARNIVDNMADALRVDQPRVRFRATGVSDKATKHADLMEMWGKHIMYRIPLHALIDYQSQAKKDLLLDSAACVKYTVDVDALPEPPVRGTLSAKAFKDALADWQVQQADAWAYNVHPLDVLTVFPAPTFGKEPAYFLEVQQRYAFQLLEEYAEDAPEKGIFRFTDPKNKISAKGGLGTVQWLEYWSSDHYIVEVDGQRIIDKVNPYGAPPYEWEWNGLGRMDESGDPAFLGESILAPVTGEIREEIIVKTAMSAQWQFHVFPRLITTIAATKARAMFMKGPGGIITVQSMDQAPKWLEVQAPNQQMVQFLIMVKENINQRFPPAINQRPAGVEAAVHQALLQGSATRPLQPIKVAMNRLSTKMLNGMARQARVMRLDMNVFGDKARSEKPRMVKADDFTHFNFEVTYEASDPAEDDRRLLTGLALMRVPRILSRKTFREIFASALNLNNSEEEEQVMTEMSVDAITEMGVLIQPILEQMGLLQQEETEEGTARTARANAVQASEGIVPGARERGLEAISGERVERGGGEAFRESGIQRSET